MNNISTQFDLKDRTKEMILIIEDSATLRELLAAEVEDMGYSAITTGNGHEALKLLETFSVNIVITGLLMPKMSGLMLAGRIRNIPSHLNTPIIMMTSASVNILNSEKDDLANEWIEKPVRPERIRETVQRYISKHQGEDTINNFAADGKQTQEDGYEKEYGSN